VTTDGVIQVTIPEMHGDNLTSVITVSGSATSVNGLPAEVISATAILTIMVPTPPNAVPPWTNGDCDGDGVLTWDDFNLARNAIALCHRKRNPTPHEQIPNGWKIHASVSAAIGEEITDQSAVGKFYSYIEEKCGPEATE
jgi:hypothetical protein